MTSPETLSELALRVRPVIDAMAERSMQHMEGMDSDEQRIHISYMMNMIYQTTWKHLNENRI